METPNKQQMSDTSLKTHNEPNKTNGYDGNAQFNNDELARMNELPYDADVTMADATNSPIVSLNGKAHTNWIDNVDLMDIHNKENTKITTELDRLIQKNDAQLYNEYEKQQSIKTSPIKLSGDGADAKLLNGINVSDATILANKMCIDDIDMSGDEHDDDCECNTTDTHIHQTRARSESPEKCEFKRARRIEMRRQSQPVSELDANDVEVCSSHCDAARTLHAPLKRGKSLSPPKLTRRYPAVISSTLTRNVIRNRYSVRSLSLLRRQKTLARIRQAANSPSIAAQSSAKSPKMTTTKLTTENKEENANASDDSEYSSLEDDGDNQDPHDSDDDDFSDIDEASRNDNKALYNSSNGFTIDQCSNNSIMLADSVPGRSPKSVPLSPSLFPFVPPYLTFVSHDDKSAAMPIAIKKVLKWKLTTITPIVIRKIILNSGFRLLKQTDDWIGMWGKHMKSPCFRSLRSYQKLNHIPGTFQIGRKDRIWRNLQAKLQQYGQREFTFMPQTYVLPQDGRRLKRLWPRFAARNTKWIIKPPASARGTGIKVVDQWKHIPKRKPLIVQKYIDRPLLINGSKFDLRLYVVVTSMNPLRAYMHTDGLARFASVKYSNDANTLNDRYMHLTNYSINKLSSNYTKNEDADSCSGHKWTLKTLWKYFQAQSINTDGLWAALRNLILRTVLTGEHVINQMTKVNVNSKYNTFELFGIDVILDAELKPWLLEVNISPSLHSSSPLDLHVKSPLVTALLNTALYQVPPKFNATQQAELMTELGLNGTNLCYDRRLFITHLSKAEHLKHNEYTHREISERDQYLDAILEDLTPDDIRCLLIAEDELARCAPLERICPTPHSHRYLKFTEHSRYYNRLLDAWETRYADNRDEGIQLLREMCMNKTHLIVTQAPKNRNAKMTPQPDDINGSETEIDDACVVSAPDDTSKPSDCEENNGTVLAANKSALLNGKENGINGITDKCKKCTPQNHTVDATSDQHEILVASSA